ncbi:hypothetical protein V6Z11_D03G176600 [Gossypium hirsutum]|uniref:Uncharacterized protein n=1 Tax=Gossypium hirsutum TaxID=3635 RepID=A0A1U8LSD1_GOSHI|nr:uncharacterized protein LOC107929260 [Gossypium hirsutum]
MLAASGSRLSDEDKIEVTLAGLPPEFEAIISSARLSTGILSLQRLVDALVDCESRQAQVLQEVHLNANLVEDAPSVEGASRGGRPLVRGRGRTFRSRVQCQICSRFGHVAQKCYYRYHRDSNTSPVERPGASSGVERSSSGVFVQNDDEQYGVPHPKSQRIFYGQGNFASQIWCAVLNNEFVDGQGNFSSQNRHVHSQNWCAGLNNDQLARASHGFSEQRESSRFYGDVHRPNVRNGLNVDRTGRPMLHGLNVAHVSSGQNIESNHGAPSSNFVQVNQADPDLPEPIENDRILRFTKPRARVYIESDVCIGLPRLGDLNASDFSDSSVSESHVNTAQLGSCTGNDGSYLPVHGDTTTWYPDSGASHHVCRDVSALRDVTPYSGCRDSGDFADGPHS